MILNHTAQDLTQLLAAELLFRALLPQLKQFFCTYTELAVSVLTAVSLSGAASVELGDCETRLMLLAYSSSLFLCLCCQSSLSELCSKLCRHFRVLEQALFRKLVRFLLEPAGHFFKVCWVKRELTSRVLQLLTYRLQLSIEL